MKLKLWLPLFILILQMPKAQAQENPIPYQKQWKKVDSLLQNGLPASAATIVQDILAQAKKDKDGASQIRSKLFLLDIRRQTSEADLRTSIRQIDSTISVSSGVEKAIWQAIQANETWRLFNETRWSIYNRTPIQNPALENIDEWAANNFFDAVGALYLDALTDKKALKETSITKYRPILIEGQNTDHLRPTTFDLLAFQALEFFQNQEKDVTNPAYKFELDDEKYFQPAGTFIGVPSVAIDSTSLHANALKIYQELLAFHLNDKDPAALIDADMHRLQFVHAYAVHPDKDSLYTDALRTLYERYKDNPAISEVAFRIIERDYNLIEGGRPTSFPPDAAAKPSLPDIKSRLLALISTYPKTHGAEQAAILIQSIDTKQLSLTLEAVYIPDENMKALVEYKNVNTVYLSLYQLPYGKALDYNRTYKTDREKMLATLKPIKTWGQTLPGTADLAMHRAEINLGKLQNGQYVLLASTSDGQATENAVVYENTFQVSSISYLNAANEDGQWVHVLDRKTGSPLNEAMVSLWANNNNIKEPYLKVNSANSDKNGRALLYQNESNARQNRWAELISIQHQGDTLFSRQFMPIYLSKNQINPAESDTTTFLFTDRAIYRPGQTIYFKGIMVESTVDKRKNEVLAQLDATVTFADVNGQALDSLKLKTNEYGSFEGKFVIPQGILTGYMSIAAGNHSVQFSVEEYKRPRFYVEYDSLKSEYQLNDSISIKGTAKAYAGSNIDNAVVKYRVERQAHFPYFWAYARFGMPRSNPVEIANGQTMTAGDGSFAIDFPLLPDRQLDPQTQPTFSYTLYADVTDNNGETRSNQYTLRAGYRSLTIALAGTEQHDSRDDYPLAIQTQNLNGQFVPATTTVTVAPLIFPGKIYRKRLWAIPDQFVLSETAFREAFPDDEYKDESNHLNWPVDTPVFEKNISTSPETAQEIIPSQYIGAEGWYLIAVSTKDATDQEITEKKYVYFSNPEKTVPAQKPLSVFANKTRLQPREELEINVKTGYEKTFVIQETADYTGSDISIFQNSNTINKTIQENDRGQLSYRWLYVHNNRLYRETQDIAIPWTNKKIQIEWATHRDKLLPGAKETWTMSITGEDKDAVAAELLTTLYDASLDAFQPHRWNPATLYPEYARTTNWDTWQGFGTASGNPWKHDSSGRLPGNYGKRYSTLLVPAGYGSMVRRHFAGSPSAEAAMSEVAVTKVALRGNSLYNATDEVQATSESETGMAVEAVQPIRSNLQETAYFLPQLKTDKDGSIQFEFTIPEALTEWKMMAFAHTTDWKTGYLEGKVKTQKDLMVMPNLPRFLRQGDQIEVSTKISNLSTKTLNGTAFVEILDATTGLTLTNAFLKSSLEQSFSADASQSSSASWTLQIPDSVFSPVAIRFFAKAGDFTDGEENTIPVITNRTLVTETLPLPVRGNQEIAFTFDKLLNQSSETLTHHALTVEFTGNPAWYAVQALPYLMEFPYECAEQTFNRFYANTLAAHIVAQSPKVKAIFDQWKEADTAALLSNLEKNQELKSALLEETPWVLEAKSESEQKQRLAQLFETSKLAQDARQNIRKLAEMQSADGGFPWFIGMQSNRYITQYIVTGLGKLAHLGVEHQKFDEIDGMIARAVAYLDRGIKNDYNELLRQKADLNKQQISPSHVQYLYMRSHFPDLITSQNIDTALNYFKVQAKAFWPTFNPFLKGQVALAAYRSGDTQTADQVMKSLRETAIKSEEMGMYWKGMPRGHVWYESGIEAQALLIEAFSTISDDQNETDALKTWLLKQKQTQHWKTTTATADACFALLLRGSDWLVNDPAVHIRLGEKTISSETVRTEAGTGYFKQTFDADEVQAEMGNISVKVDRQLNEGVAWGAVYWQYFEELDKISSAATPLNIKKQLFIERPTDRGPILTAVTEENRLQIGDKVIVRLVVTADRDMEYIHLKDMRAACFEPVNVLSGYKYQSGTGFYESTKDVSTNFFFDLIRKGTYVFEYTAFVNQKGDFSNGIATIQSMYAPEFSSHSEGIRVVVE